MLLLLDENEEKDKWRSILGRAPELLQGDFKRSSRLRFVTIYTDAAQRSRAQPNFIRTLMTETRNDEASHIDSWEEPLPESWVWFLRSSLLLALCLTVLIVPVAFWLTGGRKGLWAQDLIAAWIPSLALGLGTLARRGRQGGISLGLLLGGSVGLALSPF